MALNLLVSTVRMVHFHIFYPMKIYSPAAQLKLYLHRPKVAEAPNVFISSNSKCSKGNRLFFEVLEPFKRFINILKSK